MEEQMLLLDKRTQAMVESYIPSGDTLEGLVCYTGAVARLDADSPVLVSLDGAGYEATPAGARLLA